ncbi:MAG: hypothetical protein M3N95_05900 [Actinomycetota bacterium]|nr:hypothetical protein [Actinomycetota bacterium]
MTIACAWTWCDRWAYRAPDAAATPVRSSARARLSASNRREVPGTPMTGLVLAGDSFMASVGVVAWVSG